MNKALLASFLVQPVELILVPWHARCGEPVVGRRVMVLMSYYMRSGYSRRYPFTMPFVLTSVIFSMRRDNSLSSSVARLEILS